MTGLRPDLFVCYTSLDTRLDKTEDIVTNAYTGYFYIVSELMLMDLSFLVGKYE
jgi:hypothetical protein